MVPQGVTFTVGSRNRQVSSFGATRRSSTHPPPSSFLIRRGSLDEGHMEMTFDCSVCRP